MIGIGGGVGNPIVIGTVVTIIVITGGDTLMVIMAQIIILTGMDIIMGIGMVTMMGGMMVIMHRIVITGLELHFLIEIKQIVLLHKTVRVLNL